MKLAFAMLADSASLLPDGKIAIQGGDIDTVRTHSFPALQPTVTLVVKLIAEPSDRNNEIDLTIEGKTPQNETWFPSTSIALPWKDAGTVDRPAKHIVVINLPMLVFLTEGTYIFRLLLGTTELAAVPLYAERLASPDGEDRTLKESEE